MEGHVNDSVLPSVATIRPSATRSTSDSSVPHNAPINYSGSFDGSLDESTGLLSGVNHVKDETANAGSSWYASVFLVVNAALGAGLLNFPAAYDQSGGIWVAIGIQAALMVFIVVAIVVLLYCSDLHRCASYQDVVLAMCGRRTQLICAATVALYCFGTCITFFIIIGDQWDKFLMFAYGPTYCHHWYLTRQFTMVATSVVFVLPLCYARRIDFLKYASALGVVVVLYVVALVTAKYFIGPNNPGPIKTRPTQWTDAFGVVPVICFSYQCHLSIVPIYSCLRKRTLLEFAKTMVVALAICIFSYTGTASFGYLTFGADIQADILESYNPTADVLVAVIGLAGKMYTTYPILLFVGRSAIDNLYTSLRRLSPDDVVSGERARRVAMTTVFFVLSLTLAVIVPDIGVVISLLGGLAALFIFTFPGLCLLKLTTGGHFDSSRWRYNSALVLTAGFLVIGAFLFGVTTSQSIVADIRGTNAPNRISCQ